MEVVICKDYDEMSRRAAYLLTAEIVQNPKAVLGLATGDTPKKMYETLVDIYKKGDLDFSKVTTFNLDEYVGLSAEHEQSYAAYMNQMLMSHINIKPENVHILKGCSENPEEECALFEEKIIQAGGIDIQVLGLGHNGHIGFNEPDSQFELKTRIVQLDDRTIEANKRFFDKKSDVPTHALSMGIQTIMQAKKIILIASGVSKAEAVSKLVNGNIDSTHPASILKVHNDVIILLDKEAASKL
jgi:glucosamine-6-phosphate deaminase